MRLLFGIQFEIRPEGKVDAMGLSSDLQNRVKGWITKWYAQWKSHALDFPEDGHRAEPVVEHSLHPTASSARSGESIWGVTWAYPSDVDPSQRWEVKTAIARAGGRTEFSLTISLASKVFRVSPLRYEFGPPKIVSELVDSYPCYSGDLRLVSGARTVSSPDVPALVEELLLNPERSLPVVAVSSTGPDAPPNSQVDVDALARKLTGLGVVVLLSDKYASWSLTDALSKALSCYLGAVRVYWPGLRRDSDPLGQPLYLPLTIARIQADETPLQEVLFQRLANTASARYLEGPVFQAVRDAIRRDQDDQRKQLLDDLRGSKASAEERRRKVDELEQAIQQRDEEIRFLREENANLQRQWIEYSKSVAQSETVEPETATPAEPAIESVAQALYRSEREFPERLVFWRSARESSEECQAKLGSRVYEAFSAMNDVANQYFRARSEKRSMGMDLGRAFRLKGFDYSSKESMTAMGGKLGTQRRFRNGPAEQLVMERHLTLGGGDPVNCVRIHFEIDDERGKFIVGWCGAHLDVPSSRT